MPNLYVIAGCNGAGKTTASFTILPEILKVREFVNADSIAAGLSPFNVESVAFEAGPDYAAKDSTANGGKRRFCF
jgi:predicted ABC-type ATPase